jgi:hypothetical protein
MADDGFSVENLRVKDLPPLEPGAAKPRRRSREFVQLSRRQLSILRQGRASAPAWNVFAELVWLSWKAGGKPIKFSNHSLGELGISHDSRTRAVRELEKLELIRIDRAAPRKSPILTVLNQI